MKLAVITTPHGVNGRLKAKSFTDPADAFAAYEELTDAAGKPVKLRITGGTRDAPIVTIDGVTSRNEADLWRNKTLGVAREHLKEIAKPGAYYIADLIDMEVVDDAGGKVGVVNNVMNFGAGDILEIVFADGKADLFSFTKHAFPNIDMQAKRITFHPPEILE